MRYLNPQRHLFGLLFSGCVLLGLTACDQREDRIERAQDLTQAVRDQLSGIPVTKDTLKYVDVDARAFAAAKLANDTQATKPDQTARYIIGSIVAKPRDLPPPIVVAAVIAEPDTAFDVDVDNEADAKIVIPDRETLQAAEADPELIEQIEHPANKQRKITVVDPRSRVPTRSIQRTGQVLPRAPLKDKIREQQVARGEAPPPPESAEVRIPESAQMRVEKLPKLPPKLASRALTMRTDALERQIEAEDRMIETVAKYQLAASIQRSRSGQMVIEIGADALNPTAFEALVMQQGGVAVESELDCATPNRSARNNNPLMAMQCVIEDLQASGEFEYVERDYVFEHQMLSFRPVQTPTYVKPDDALFTYQWNFQNQGRGEDEAAGGASFVDFWTDKATTGSQDVVVAVVDTGLQMDHPDIRDSENVVAGWDMVSDMDVGNDGDSRDSNPDDPGDICPERGVFANTYHGTHVAGIIGAGATNNRDGVAGGAWNVKIVPVRALGKCGGRLSDINDAIRWAAGTIPEYDTLGNEVWNAHPADIINLSIGLFRACPASMQDAIDAVTERGVVVVAAAGNDQVSTDIYAPAGCRNVVTVAGGDARGYLAPYSNYGPGVDILAPGGDLTRDDNGDGNPDGILSTKTAENCADPVTGAPVDTCYYAYEQGTSMATPHVSAALALIKAKRPEMTSSELVSTLMSGISSIPTEQCVGDCLLYPGAEPTADDPDMCLRPCGRGLLNLAEIDLPD